MTIATTEVPGIDALSKRLRMARIGADLDQTQIADRLGVGRNTVSNWETGRSEPSATHFVQWSLVCGVPLEWLGAVNAETASTEVETVSADASAPRGTRTPNLLIRSQTPFWSDERALIFASLWCQVDPDTESTLPEWVA